MFGLGKGTTRLLVVVALAAMVAALSGCGLNTGGASPRAASERTITVMGTGKVSAPPNLAQASVGVETIAATVAEASQKNNEKMAALMAKLKALGIAEKDIQTSNFSINSYNTKGEPDAGPNQYRVSNMVQIKIRDLQKVGPVLDGVIQAGANQVWGIGFAIEDQKALVDEARSKAVEDARQRAEALAKLTNVQVGEVLKVSESGVTGPIFETAMAYGKGGDGGTPVSPGEVQVTFQVQVSYAIR